MSSAIPTYYQRIERFCRMLFLATYRISFTSWPVMCWNCISYQTFLPHRWCTVTYFPPLVGWESVNCSPWCVHYFSLLEGTSCHVRKYQPWSFLMLVTVGYEQKNNSHIDCYISLYGVSVPILVTGCFLSPLCCTKIYFGIQEGHQSCWCMLLLHYSGHVDILHQ